MRRMVAAPVLVLLLLIGGCTPPDGAPVEVAPGSGRTPDLLLFRPELQDVVASQQARDGDALLAFLDHGSPDVRARAAFALGSVQDTAAVPRLLELLLDLEPEVRADAAFALGQMPATGLATPLFDALKVEWDPAARLAQVDAVGKRCEPAAAARLRQIQVPGLEWAVVRAMARCVLADVAGDTLWPRLVESLTHPDPRVREWAAYPFGRHPQPAVWRDHRIALRRALATYDADDRAAMHLLRALGRIRDTFSWDLQEWWLRNGAQWEIRANAAEALGRSEMVGALARLLPGIDDPSVHVRTQTILALGSSPPGPVVVDALRARLERYPDDTATGGLILELLARAGIPEPLETWFDRPDLDREPVVLAGVRGAAALEGERGVELLLAGAAGGSPRASRAALASLVERWEVSRRFPEARPTFYRAFLQLSENVDGAVAGAARRALRDTLFAPLGGGPVTGEGGTASEVGGGVVGASPPARRDRVDWAHLRSVGERPRLHLLTNRGEVVLRLSAEEAPLTVDQITRLAQEGRFDGIPFHRVVSNFVVQGGDVTLDGRLPPAPRIRSEFTRISFETGVVGMASAGKDTETSQYFITHSPQPHLDGGYTAFGRVVEGMTVVDALAPEDRVLEGWVVPGR